MSFAPRRSVPIALACAYVAVALVAASCAAPARAQRVARRDTPAPADAPAAAVTVAWGAPLPFAPTLVAADTRGAVVVGSLGVAAHRTDGALAWHTRVANVGLEVPAIDARTVALASRVGDDPRTGSVVVLDRADGELRWERALGAPPGPVALGSDTVFVSVESADGARSTLHAFDERSGATRWSAELPGRVARRSAIVVDPATDTVVTVSDAGGRWVLGLHDAATGAEEGGLDLGVAGSASAPALVEPGWAVVGNGSTGEVLGLDLVGRAVGWVERLEVGFDPSSPPAVGGGLVVVADDRGDLHALDARSGAHRWHAPLGAPLLGARPTVAGGLVAVADWGGAVHVVAAADGTALEAPVPGGVATGLAAVRDALVVAVRTAEPDRLEAWRAPAPGPER